MFLNKYRRQWNAWVLANSSILFYACVWGAEARVGLTNSFDATTGTASQLEVTACRHHEMWLIDYVITSRQLLGLAAPGCQPLVCVGLKQSSRTGISKPRQGQLGLRIGDRLKRIGPDQSCYNVVFLKCWMLLRSHHSLIQSIEQSLWYSVAHRLDKNEKLNS